ncbi:MAG: tetratricopeptide repeat protein [Ramlibacter sp.]
MAQLHRDARHAELEEAATRLLREHPQHGFLWKALGVACTALGKHEQALAAKLRAAQLLPNDAEAHGNLANAVAKLPQPRDALRPSLAHAHNQLGNFLRDAHRMPEARKRYEEALALQPGLGEALSNLGNTLSDLGLVHEAEARYRQALEALPGRAEIHSNLGNLLKEQGRLQEAQVEYRAAVARDPTFLGGHSNLLLAMNHELGLPTTTLKEAALRFGEYVRSRAGAPLAVPAASPPHRPLRVGFVSGDLRNHPVGYFLEGLLAHIDPVQLQLLAYTTIPRTDELSKRIRPRFHQWQCIAALDDEAAARKVHADGIDVLIDLAGHTAYNRLGVFAWRPAPVQASWLGYFATTGVPTMDWLVSDRASIAPSEHDAFSERIWYLPRTRLCFQPPAQAPDVAPLPALATGAITFGSFQNLGKINDRVLGLWGRVMQALPQSRLRLQNTQVGDAWMAEQLRQRLNAAGIDPQRVEMHGRTSRRAYMEAHAQVDMILDTFPYPGGTTTCEALWMGVPTVTLQGERMLSRQGASLLGAAGLAEWIAKDEAGYVQLAVSRASDLPALGRLRADLREHVRVSALFDAKSFAADFTETLQGMVRRRVP